MPRHALASLLFRRHNRGEAIRSDTAGPVFFCFRLKGIADLHRDRERIRFRGYRAPAHPVLRHREGRARWGPPNDLGTLPLFGGWQNPWPALETLIQAGALERDRRRHRLLPCHAAVRHLAWVGFASAPYRNTWAYCGKPSTARERKRRNSRPSAISSRFQTSNSHAAGVEVGA